MTDTTPAPFPTTAHLIGLDVSLERVNTRRGTGNVAGKIVAVDSAPAGATQTTATVRDADGIDHLVRLPRYMVSKG